MSTIEYAAKLTVVKCWCGMRHAVPEELAEFQVRQHRDGEKQTSIYCPLGHQHVKAGEGEAEKLRKQLAAQQSAHDQTKAALRDTENKRKAALAATTKLKNRAAAGVCPCCNRTFKQLARHMQAKHPEFREASEWRDNVALIGRTGSA